MPQATLIDGTEIYGLESAADFATPPAMPWFDYAYRKSARITDISWLTGQLQSRWNQVSVGFAQFMRDSGGQLFLTDQTQALDMLNAGMGQADDVFWLYTETGVNYLLGGGDTSTTAAPSAEQLATLTSAVAANPTKRLLYDARNIAEDNLRPSAQRYAEIAARIRGLPFSGLSFQFKGLNDAYTDSLDWRIFANVPGEATDETTILANLQAQLGPLSGVDLGSCRLYSTVLPNLIVPTVPNSLSFGITDYFDSWDLLLTKMAMLCRAIYQDGHFAGLWFDNESYDGRYDNYSEQKYNGSKTSDEYVAQVSLRGRQLGQVMLDEFPNIEVVVLVPPFWSKPGIGNPNHELLGPLVAGIATTFYAQPVQYTPIPSYTGVRMSSALLGS